jgi:uncharacterized membrane protein YeiB
MILVNVGPTTPEDLWQRIYLLPFGRASVLFITIAGVGMGYFLRSRRGRQLWSTLSWRIVLLLLLGLVLQTLTDRVNLILQTYALLFLLAPFLARLRTPVLAGVGLALLVLGPAWIVHHDVQEPWGHGLDGVSLTTPPGEAVHSLLVTGPYPLASWTVPFIAGLLLSRLDLTDRRLQHRLLVVGGILAAAAFVIADLFYAALGSAADTGYARLLTGVGHGQMPLWLISSTAGALFVIAGCEVLFRRRPGLIGWLGATGRLAFTIYILHVLVLAVIKPAGGFSFAQGFTTTLALTSTAVALALLWARTGRQGPLEWLLRRAWLRSPVTTPTTPATTTDRTR